MAEQEEIKFTKASALATIAELKEENERLTEAKTIEVVKTVEIMSEVTITNSGHEGNIGALAGALSKVQSQLKAVGKGQEGYGYNFADLASILAYIQPIYTKTGLSVVQLNVSKMFGKTPLIGVKTILIHSDGGMIWGEIYIPTQRSKQNPLIQMAGVNMSYLRRYGIQSLLGLATTDNDGAED